MIILFPDNPMNPREVEPDFAAEFDAARTAGFDCSLVSDAALRRSAAVTFSLGDIDPQSDDLAALYRGWMLKPKEYGGLHDQLTAVGLHPVNGPDAYRACHYLPDSYAFIRDRTPRTVFEPCDANISRDKIANLVKSFGAAPLIVKDYVKSQKHLWDEACFIPTAADLDNVERVTRRFLALQDDDLNEGLVYREFVRLRQIGTHPRSGIPLHLEFRAFFLDAQPIAMAPYWDATTYPDSRPNLDDFSAIAASIPSRFFSMDIAMTESGEWIIVELGDGQVSGLPERIDPLAFYRALANGLRG
ncbi:MAG TPA: ATP-grasp domain-containing protein [Phycisphaerae bacterium]|nr:ATP-grasp domain-containing protein [Phycisphaerae bacterium]HRW52411.1 ATP-grasp domain-containing protein [Phycisphaerae bacterium]